MKLVAEVIRQDTAEMQAEAMKIVPVDSGDLKRSIGINVKPLEGRVYASMHYAPYVEFGTRFMNEQPYIRPAYSKEIVKFQAQIKEIIGRDV